MHIRSAVFVKGVVGPDPLLDDGKPQIALIGRSNVGKSSTINTLTRKNGLAKHSATPGHTKELNVYRINDAFYLVDLPGYGYSASSKGEGNRQQERIGWYLFQASHRPRLVVLIVDANTGATRTDLEMLAALEHRRAAILVVANKIDKIKPSVLPRQLRELQECIGDHLIIPYSAAKGIGVAALGNAIEEYV